MVVLVLCAVEGDRVGVLDGHCKGWLTGGLARLALQESRVERAIGLAGSAAASSSRSDGMVLRSSARMDQVDERLAYSGNPNELDCVTSVGGDGSGGEDPLATSANLDLVGGSIDGRNASRSSNDELGEMHG
jgi:hypothetical protein